MDWTVIPRAEWISLAALLIACASASFTWRNLRISARKERREVEATRPIVEQYAEYGYEALPRDFHVVRVVIRNRASHGLSIDSFTMVDPAEAHFYNGNWLPAGDPPDMAAYELAMRAATRPKLPIDRVIEPHGAREWEVYLVPLRPIPEVRLQVSLSERLPEIRRSAITVKIKLPEDTIKAVSERSRVRPSVV